MENSEKRQMFKMPLFGNSPISEFDSKESWDDRLNSPKSGILNFWRFSEFSVAFFRVGRSQPIGARKLLSAQCVSKFDYDLPLCLGGRSLSEQLQFKTLELETLKKAKISILLIEQFLIKRI